MRRKEERKETRYIATASSEIFFSRKEGLSRFLKTVCCRVVLSIMDQGGFVLLRCGDILSSERNRRVQEREGSAAFRLGLDEER